MWRPRDRERFIGAYDPEHEMPDPDRDPGDRWQSDAYRRGARDTRFAYRMSPDRIERGYAGPRRDVSRDMDARWRGDARDYEREQYGGRWSAGGGQWDRDYDRGGYGAGGGYGHGGYGYGGYGYGGGGYGGDGYDRNRWGGDDDRSFDRGWNRDFDRDREYDRGGFMTGPRFDRDRNWGSDRGWDTDRGSDRWDRGSYDDWQRDWRRR